MKKLLLLAALLLPATDTLPSRKSRKSHKKSKAHTTIVQNSSAGAAIVALIKIKQAVEMASKGCAMFYEIESFRTALIRSVMAAGCFADGVITGGEASIVALAVASVFTATAYDASSSTRCAFLPNIVADGIATIASTDAGWLPITGTAIETQARSIIGAISSCASGLSFIF